MSRPKSVVPAGEAVAQPAPAPAPVTQSDAPEKQVTVFWKVMNPHEKILLEDGGEIVFGNQTFATADEVLINKISAVAQRYGILVQQN